MTKNKQVKVLIKKTGKATRGWIEEKIEQLNVSENTHFNLAGVITWVPEGSTYEEEMIKKWQGKSKYEVLVGLFGLPHKFCWEKAMEQGLIA